MASSVSSRHHSISLWSLGGLVNHPCLGISCWHEQHDHGIHDLFHAALSVCSMSLVITQPLASGARFKHLAVMMEVHKSQRYLHDDMTSERFSHPKCVFQTRL